MIDRMPIRSKRSWKFRKLDRNDSFMDILIVGMCIAYPFLIILAALGAVVVLKALCKM